MLRILISALFLAFTSLHLYAKDCDSIDLNFFEMRLCFADKVSGLDKQLSNALSDLQLVIAKAYSNAPENNEASLQEVLVALDKSQNSWKIMVDADCDLSYNLARGGNGTGAPLAVSRCLSQHYQIRLDQIFARVNDIKETL